MYDAVTVLLREYWRTTGWNDQSSYLNLSKASDVLLDFAVPHGVSLSSLSISPEAAFTAHTRILTVPLSGTIAYSNARTNSPFNFKCVSDPLQRMTRAALFIEPDAGVPHSVFDPNKSREMLVYGGVHIPSACVEALCALRLSDDWQLLTTAFSRAPRYPMVPLGRLLGFIPPKRSGQVYPPPDMSVGPPVQQTFYSLFSIKHPKQHQNICIPWMMLYGVRVFCARYMSFLEAGHFILALKYSLARLKKAAVYHLVCDVRCLMVRLLCLVVRRAVQRYGQWF